MTQLELTPGSRVNKLFNYLEADFEQYLNQLPSGLKNVARQHSAYHGDQDSQRFEGLSSLNPVLVGSPWLFWDLFENLDDKTFRSLAAAGAFFVLASVVMDHLLDGQTTFPGILSLYHQSLYSQALARYRASFPPNTPFWEQFFLLDTRHVAGLSLEWNAQSHPGKFSDVYLRKISYGKVAPINTTLAAFCIASGKQSLFPKIEKSLNHIAVASQMLDDFGDWRADLASGHLTYFLSQVVTPEDWLAGIAPPADTIQEVIQSKWLDVSCLKNIISELEKSVSTVKTISCPVWAEYVNEYLALANEHLEIAVTEHLHQVMRNFG